MFPFFVIKLQPPPTRVSGLILCGSSIYDYFKALESSLDFSKLANDTQTSSSVQDMASCLTLFHKYNLPGLLKY
jgi:hypothetical protein